MGIAIYDAEQDLYTGSPLRAVINGHLGGPHEEKLYIRNDDASRWYTNVSLEVTGNPTADGISFKFLYGERRPTEAEWDPVISGDPLDLPDIGTTAAADTSTYHPVWVRIYLPGNTPADIIDDYTIQLKFLPRLVGL